MNEAVEVLSLIGDIYDAALDATMWSCVLERMCRFVGGSASTLYSEDSATKTGKSHHTWGFDRRYGWTRRPVCLFHEQGGSCSYDLFGRKGLSPLSNSLQLYFACASPYSVC